MFFLENFKENQIKKSKIFFSFFRAEAEEKFELETERFEKCKADAAAAQKEIDKIAEMKVAKVSEKKLIQR